MPTKDPHAAAVAELRRSAGVLGTAATARMEADLPWFSELSAEARSYVGLIVQAGVRSFIDWYGDGGTTEPSDHLASSVFGAAPRAMAGVINLQQTVDLIRLSLDAVEDNLGDRMTPELLAETHGALLRYGRELAFATAAVYARAAEVRGAWDARLEALVVDAVLRGDADEDLLSRASAVGWTDRGNVAVLVGHAPEGRDDEGLFNDVRRTTRDIGMDALCAVQGHRLVVILGGVRNVEKAGKKVVDFFDPGPVVIGSVVPDLGSAHLSAAGALSGLTAISGWPEAPRPVSCEELLPERILGGDPDARQIAIDEIHGTLAGARGALIETLSAYFDNGGGIEATARALYVHANTVRYRLAQVGDLTGLTPSQQRDALTLRLALILGRQSL